MEIAGLVLERGARRESAGQGGPTPCSTRRRRRGPSISWVVSQFSIFADTAAPHASHAQERIEEGDAQDAQSQGNRAEWELGLSATHRGARSLAGDQSVRPGLRSGDGREPPGAEQSFDVRSENLDGLLAG